jgi:hypothetical protein
MKNYLFYLKHQLQLYGLGILTASSVYGIVFYFQGCDPLPVDPDHIIGFVSYSLTYVFLGAYFYKYVDSKKKRIKNFK